MMELRMNPFRFGVSFLGPVTSRDEWLARVRRAEEFGFDTVLLADHLVPLLSPFSALAIAAEATERIRLGTLVLNNDFRHPVITARESATLDLLSGGRFELGIGAGHSRDEYDQAGIPFDPPRVRVQRLAEAAQVFRQFFDTGSATFEGQYYRLAGHELHPKPAQQPLPLLIGGNGRRVLETAGRYADIVSFTGFFPTPDGRSVVPSHFTSQGLEERVAVVRSAAGSRFDHLELSCLVQRVIVTDDRQAVAEQIAQRVAGTSAADILDSPFFLLGTEDQVAAQLLALRESLGISYITVFEHSMEPLAPVVARFAGR
jgi:probable F420-dependent oxidoreductase